VKGDPFGVIRKTALSLVGARRAEGNSSKVGKHYITNFVLTDPLQLIPDCYFPQHKDFLQLMLDATMEGEDGITRSLTDEDIVSSSTSFLLAGYETTANTLAYASYLLALNPEIQEKLQAKIDEYFESNPVSI